MRGLIVLITVSLLAAGCSIEQTAVNYLGNALSGGGGVYTFDNDPELIREALPFGLKTYEGLLEVSPENSGLLLAAAQGFAAYAYLLQQDADKLNATDLSRSRQLQGRATNLYVRARDYAIRGLKVKHENFGQLIYSDTDTILMETTKDDIPFLYWAGAAWAGALSAKKGDVALIAELPLAGAMVERILELDEGYDSGAAYEFLITYEGTRPGGSAEAARANYDKALKFSEGKRAGVYVALAEAVSIGEQNVDEFRELIASAKSVDPDLAPEFRLVNTIAQQRAAWLETRISDLFFEAD